MGHDYKGMVVLLLYKSVGITMQTSIFGKPLSEVTIQDVKIFCDKQIREGINLDYKRDLTSKSLLKTMAAFANTRGGFINVGVDDENDKPKLPIEGIEWKESLPLSVTSTIVDNMYPYLSVDVHVCKPENGKTFVLIYVPESHEAPHWLFNRTELYVRRADRTGHTHWERFATDGEWDFLRNKRERSVELRNQALEVVKDIFEAENRTDKRKGLRVLTSSDIKPIYHWGMLRTVLVPLFPREIMCDVLTLNKHLMTERIPTLLRDYEYPQLDIQTKVFQEGAYKYEADSRGLAQSFSLLTRFGVVATYERVVQEQEKEPNDFIHFGHALASIEATLRYAGKLYDELAYTGSVMCNVNLVTMDNTALFLIDRTQHSSTLPRNLQGYFAWKVEPTVSDLNDPATRTEMLYEIMQEFTRSFGYAGNSDQFVDKWLEKSGLYPKSS
jgi:hypothetical protein